MERDREPKGFGMIEFPALLMALCLWVAAAIPVIAIPNLMSSRVHANETSVIAALRDYAVAQALFHKGRYNQHASAGHFVNTGWQGVPEPKPESYDVKIRQYAHPYFDLYRLADNINDKTAPIALITESFARANAPERAWNGYWFTHGTMTGPDPKHFDLFALPVEYSVTGNNIYHINETGVIRQRDPGRNLTPADLPLGAVRANDGWIDS